MPLDSGPPPPRNGQASTTANRRGPKDIGYNDEVKTARSKAKRQTIAVDALLGLTEREAADAILIAAHLRDLQAWDAWLAHEAELWTRRDREWGQEDAA